jgi:hypothetical protein
MTAQPAVRGEFLKICAVEGAASMSISERLKFIRLVFAG